MKKASVLHAVQMVARVLPLVIIAAFALYIWWSGATFSIETLLEYVPDRLMFAIAFFLCLFIIKSLSVFLPIAVLYILGGLVFEPFWGMVLNTIGACISISIPYWIGRYSAADSTKHLLDKHPKVQKLLGRLNQNEWFLSYFLRVINCLPFDLVSMYLGAQKFRYPRYLIGSLCGVLPSMVLTTLIGESLQDPSSPMFIIAVCLTVLLSAISVTVYYFTRKKHQVFK